MILCGAPVEIPNHAELIVDYGFSIIDAIGKVLDPSTQDPMSIRVGRCGLGVWLLCMAGVEKLMYMY